MNRSKFVFTVFCSFFIACGFFYSLGSNNASNESYNEGFEAGYNQCVKDFLNALGDESSSPDDSDSSSSYYSSSDESDYQNVPVLGSSVIGAPYTDPDQKSDYVEGENTVRVESNYKTFWATSNLKLRSGPGTEYDTLDIIPYGHNLSIDFTTYDDWERVYYDGQVGYVSTDYLTSNKIDTSDYDDDFDYYDHDEIMVWIPQSGNKYHKTSHCGNMDSFSSRLVPRSDALNFGYMPCSNCY